jgi:hypothetical protein
MSYAHMKKREAELQAEVDRWLAAAAAADTDEDAIHGSKRGDEMPAWVADKTKRIEKIRAAKAELEAEAKAAADEERRVKAEAEERRLADGRKKNGKSPARLERARSELTTQLHRCREPHSEDQGRLYPRL